MDSGSAAYPPGCGGRPASAPHRSLDLYACPKGAILGIQARGSAVLSRNERKGPLALVVRFSARPGSRKVNHPTNPYKSMSCPSFLFVGLLAVSATVGVSAQDAWTAEQLAVLDAIERLSAATGPGGGGAEAYAETLAEDYSRWTLGSDKQNGKKEWVDGIRGWFDEGWRVTDRRVENLDVTIRGNIAFTRRRVHETYLGPDGSRSSSASAVAEVWIKEAVDSTWKLSRVDIHPLEVTP